MAKQKKRKVPEFDIYYREDGSKCNKDGELIDSIGRRIGWRQSNNGGISGLRGFASNSVITQMRYEAGWDNIEEEKCWNGQEKGQKYDDGYRGKVYTEFEWKEETNRRAKIKEAEIEERRKKEAELAKQRGEQWNKTWNSVVLPILFIIGIILLVTVKVNMR